MYSFPSKTDIVWPALAFINFSLNFTVSANVQLIVTENALLVNRFNQAKLTWIIDLKVIKTRGRWTGPTKQIKLRLNIT